MRDLPNAYASREALRLHQRDGRGRKARPRLHGWLLHLTLLTLGLVEEILNNNQSDPPGLPRLMKPMQWLWNDQQHRDRMVPVQRCAASP